MTAEQPKNSNRAAHLAPYQFKKGQSGNPLGRPIGAVSLKERAKRYLANLNDDEAEEYFEGMNKRDVWEMGEGKAQADITSGGQPIAMTVINYADSDDTPPVSA